jgi:HK97 family phage major capsid protein
MIKSMLKRRGYRGTMLFLNLFTAFLAPFLNMQAYVVDGGAGSAGDEAKLLESIKKQTNEQLDSFKKGLITTEQLTEKLTELQESAKSITHTATEVKTLKDLVDTLQKAVGDQSIEIKKLKEEGVKSDDIDVSKQLETDIKGWINSDAFKQWKESGKGSSPELALKYSLTSGRTGTVLMSSTSNIVSDAFQPRKVHIRELMSVVPTDMPNHVFDQVSSWTPGVDVIDENGNAPTFDIVTAEQTATVKRLSGIMDISNNALRSAAYLTRHILNRAPEKLLCVEDANIIFGNGSGNNLDGIYKNAKTFNLTGPSFIAGAVSSVATYNLGTAGDSALITFAAAHGLTNANVITFASATATRYNAALSVIVKNEKQIIVVPTGGYTAEADTSSWTATSKHNLYNSVDNANEYDVLVAAKAYMSNSEYSLTAWVLNPATIAKIQMLKSTTNEPLYGTEGYQMDFVNGVYYIAGLPVIESNAIPADKFLGGDFQRAAELLQYEGMTLRFVEDVTYVKANKQALYISEQVLLPLYNPFMFVKGVFATCKTALETP